MHAQEDPQIARADRIEDACEEEQDRIHGCAFQNNSNNMEKVEAAWLTTRGTICSVLTDETKGDEACSENILENDNWKSSMR